MDGTQSGGDGGAVGLDRLLESIGGDLVVASNRQPYRHDFDPDGDGVVVDRPAGGLTAGLDAAMCRTGGTWIAWGDGEADPAVVDDDDRVPVPPEEDAYSLRRLWLSEAAVEQYYYGISNQVLWPLCHAALGTVTATDGAWAEYRSVNEQFAGAIEDSTDAAGIVWLQDYHLALAPRFVRESSSADRFLVHSWHIPWPAWDTFRACPHREELLRGLLGNDLLGFHVPRYCHNFLRTVDAALPAATVDYDGRGVNQDDGSEVDHHDGSAVHHDDEEIHHDDNETHHDSSTVHHDDEEIHHDSSAVDHDDDEIHHGGVVHHDGRTTAVRAFPMGVPAERIRQQATSMEAAGFREAFTRTHGIDRETRLAIGVDRLDYTKGIPERLAALEQLFAASPRWRGDLTYVQVGTESRSWIPAYARYQDRVAEAVDSINERFGTETWQPVVYTTEMISDEGLAGLYRAADLALVSPVRDGMNLVAQEYVAAQAGSNTGVLLLSDQAGVHDRLGDWTLSIRPHDTGDFAAKIDEGLTMGAPERRRRFERLEGYVFEHDIESWVGSVLATVEDRREGGLEVSDATR